MMRPSEGETGASQRERHRTSVRSLPALLALALALLALVLPAPATALTTVEIGDEQERIDLTPHGDVYEGRGDTLQVETAPDTTGATFRVSVKATTAGTNPSWFVFALRNGSTKPIERWLIADRYTATGSGIVWPDLDARRIENVTQTEGLAPERIRNDRGDVFRINIEPGRTVTFVAELSSDRLARMQLWKPLTYEQRLRDRQLFHGILLGITTLLAVFLTAVFAANHKMIFPAAALVAWSVLAYLLVDFGFWHRLFPVRPEDNAVYRAVTEAAVAASLVTFLFVFLRGNLWHGFLRMLFLLWIAAQIGVVAAAAIDPRLAVTIARLSLGVIGVIGAATIAVLALSRLDRALALAPTWILLLVWLFGAAVTLTGRLSAEVAVSGLVSGLVLITVLLGFTVTQFAFRPTELAIGGSASDRQLRAAAVESAGVGVFEWNVRRDEIKVDPVIETTLGLDEGDLSGRLDEFLNHVHQGDRERFQLQLQSVKERGGGAIRLEFRLLHADSSYRWIELEGAAIGSGDHRSMRCVGLMRDVTDNRRAQERLLHDAVHDSLTGLPNRELFLDRLSTAMIRPADGAGTRPTILFLDLDKFKSINSSFGLVVGDSLLLTVARRLARSLGPRDTLARIGGDQFAILVLGEQDPRDLALLAERVRRSLRSPIKIADQEIVLTGSIGIAIAEDAQKSGAELLSEAETAMYRAKRAGSDRIELFTPQMRGERDERIAIESDLRRAIDEGQLDVLYQPIVALSNEAIVGFEALVRWEHPRHGHLSPAEFIPVAEETDLVVKLGSYVLARAIADASRWQKEWPRQDQPLFVSVNVSSRQLIKPDIVNEIRHLLTRTVLARGSVRVEITESLVMENPERATYLLELLKEAGVDLALDDFGAGYSSLAYLQRFPFDTIKIDRALVQGATASAGGGAIVRSIVALAHELERRVIGEGIETAEDAAFLRGIGCEWGQGFYYGRPVPQREALELVRMQARSEKRMRRRGLVVTGPTRDKGGEEQSGVRPDGAASAVPAAASNGPVVAPGPAAAVQPAPPHPPSDAASPPTTAPPAPSPAAGPDGAWSQPFPRPVLPTMPPGGAPLAAVQPPNAPPPRIDTGPPSRAHPITAPSGPPPTTVPAAASAIGSGLPPPGDLAASPPSVPLAASPRTGPPPIMPPPAPALEPRSLEPPIAAAHLPPPVPGATPERSLSTLPPSPPAPAIAGPSPADAAPSRADDGPAPPPPAPAAPAAPKPPLIAPPAAAIPDHQPAATRPQPATASPAPASVRTPRDPAPRGPTPLRRPTSTTLSPAMAASLARLAGTLEPVTRASAPEPDDGEKRLPEPSPLRVADPRRGD